MAQFLRPTSDIATGGWTATPLWSKVDEGATGDDVTITSDDNSSPDIADFGCNAVTDPEVSTGHILRAQWNKNAAGGHLVTANLELWQGTPGSGTQIAVLSVVDLSETVTDSTYTLTGTEADSITDYSALSLRLSRTGDTGGPPGNRRQLVVDFIELETPDAPTTTPGEVTASAEVSVALRGEVTAPAEASVARRGQVAAAASIAVALAGAVTAAGSLNVALPGEASAAAELSVAQTGQVSVAASLNISGQATGEVALPAELAVAQTGQATAGAETAVALRSEAATSADVSVALRAQATTPAEFAVAARGAATAPAELSAAQRGAVTAAAEVATARRGAVTLAASVAIEISQTTGQVALPATLDISREYRSTDAPIMRALESDALVRLTLEG